MDDTKRIQLGLRCFSTPESSRISEIQESSGYLTADNLKVVIHKKELLNHISFSASAGDIIAVTGPNGAGKTQLLRVLCGLSREKSGRILIDGRLSTCRNRRNHCTMTMQDVVHQLFTDSVYEELAIMDSQAGEKRIEELLNHLDLLGYKDRHSMTLSGGQKQRLVLAAASLSGREIMLFDEPASGLDYKNMCRVCQLIREISRYKIVFAATHDRELISLLCTKELRMENGTSRFLNLIKS